MDLLNARNELPEDESGSEGESSEKEPLVLAGETTPRLKEPETEATRTRGGGPRTRLGKEKSKNNALKHGLFSRSVVLEGELREEYEALLSGLQNDFEPKGTSEGATVEKLAVLYWRYRRFIASERERPTEFSMVPLVDLDLSIRYESNLDRGIDRTLNQLERLQRMRKGQPAPPALSLNVMT
jgi:hypothetical protein